MNTNDEKNLKKCRVCGKAIIDENNKTGLCPKHQDKVKSGGVVALAVLSAALGVVLPKVLKKR